MIILNGLDLEVPTEKLALANKKPGARILKLGDQTIGPQEYVFDRSFPAPLDTLIRTLDESSLRCPLRRTGAECIGDT